MQHCFLGLTYFENVEKHVIWAKERRNELDWSLYLLFKSLCVIQ